MPKFIPDLRNRILASARNQLIQFGFDGLSLRRVATDCSIAVGTTHNYFPSKTDLATEVLQSDWLKLTKEIEEDTKQCDDVIQAIMILFNKLRIFANDYHQLLIKLNARSLSEDPVIVNDTRIILSHILARYGYQEEDSCLNFETKLLLTSISFSDVCENDFVTVLRRQFRS